MPKILFQTGINDLDKLLYGGVPAGYIVTCAGKPGSGKTFVLRQFALQGLKENELVIYIAPFKSPERIVEAMHLQNLEFETKKINFFIFQGVNSTNPEINQIGNFNSLNDLVIAILEFIKESNAKKIRLVLENLSSFFVIAKKEQVFEFLKELFLIVRKNNIVALLEVHENSHDEIELAKIQSLTDGDITFKIEDTKRFLMVKRLQDTIIDIKWIPFELKQGEGIKILEFFK